jgi:hypothetical protein
MARRAISIAVTAVVLGFSACLFQCGGGGGDGADGGDATVDGTNPFGDGGQVTSLMINPQNPTVAVTITDGVVATTPITFTATASGGGAVPASFTLDRGELGALGASTGIFTASGNVPGVGTVTATDTAATAPDGGAATASTSLTVTIGMSQNGKPAGDGGTGSTLGGNNGVGGNDYGGVVDQPTKAILDGPATTPANASELGFLYPYDQTVWPQGTLAPLLQWQSTHASATTALKIHLAEKGFTFDGYYAAPGWTNEAIDESAWNKALYGNQGDPLEVDVWVTDGKTSWGPITEHWVVARGVLQGTVYYNSYNSYFSGSGNGAVLAIKPGAIAPTLAIPGSNTDCHVCHEVSANGGTLYMMDHTYTTEGSFDLTANGTQIQPYTGGTTAPDGTVNDAKFVWSGVYPDGTFAMTSSTHTVVYSTLDSNLYRRSDGAAVTYQSGITETGWSNVVTQAITPSFSPDGHHLAFNFWSGPGDGTTVARNGHSLDMIDFNCGQGLVDGGAASQCGGSTYAFYNLRELYYDANRYMGWPGFTPDSKGIIFHNAVKSGTSGWADDQISTWSGAEAELWYTDVGTTPQPLRMNALNGLDGSSTSYLPTNSDHPNDTILNYEPTMNPIASGGYYWVVFTSRRMYGNVATGDPWSGYTGAPIPKKLWVAAIDINPTPGKDPSHPAFYLPGQEINAGNSRGFWVVDPCKANGNSCVTGDECCNGFCRQGDGGGLVCSNNPGGCSQQYESCTTDADCCGAGALTCVNGHCAQKNPN